MTNIIFSFDTEDFENDTDDAVLFWAKLLRKQRIRGCFCLVGEKVRALLRRGRRDVLEALSGHEIDYHSNYHSMHPTHAEMLEEAGWFDGVDRVILQEAGGIFDVETATGQRPVAYCKPGSSWGPQVVRAMRLMGLPVFCDAPFEFSTGHPLWYCGQLLIRYHMSFDSFFESENPFGEMMARLESLLEHAGEGCIVIYTHPCRLLTTRFTDNFRWGRNTPRERWERAPLREPDRIRFIKEFAEAFVKEMAAREDLRPITYSELLQQYREDPYWVDRQVLMKLVERTREVNDFQIIGDRSFSPAQIFALVVEALCGFVEKGSLEASLPVRDVLGPLQDPPATRPFTAPWADMIDAAASSFEEIQLSHSIPGSVEVGENVAGPGAALRAFSQMIWGILRGEAPPEEVSVPADSAPRILSWPMFRDLRFKSSFFPPDFEGENVLRQIRLQAWTARPAIRRKG